MALSPDQLPLAPDESASRCFTEMCCYVCPSTCPVTPICCCSFSLHGASLHLHYGALTDELRLLPRAESSFTHIFHICPSSSSRRVPTCLNNPNLINNAYTSAQTVQSQGQGMLRRTADMSRHNCPTCRRVGRSRQPENSFESLYNLSDRCCGHSSPATLWKEEGTYRRVLRAYA